MERAGEDSDYAGEFCLERVGDGGGGSIPDHAQSAVGLAKPAAPGQAGGADIGEGATVGGVRGCELVDPAKRHVARESWRPAGISRWHASGTNGNGLLRWTPTGRHAPALIAHN